MLLLVGAIEVVIALLGLPYMIGQVTFYDIGSYIRLFVYLAAAGLLPFASLRVLQRRPLGWAWMILGHIFWFSWAAVSIDFFEELLRALV